MLRSVCSADFFHRSAFCSDDPQTRKTFTLSEAEPEKKSWEERKSLWAEKKCAWAEAWAEKKKLLYVAGYKAGYLLLRSFH